MMHLKKSTFTSQNRGVLSAIMIADSSYQIADSMIAPQKMKKDYKAGFGRFFLLSYFQEKKKTVFFLCYLFVINNIKIYRNEEEKKSEKTPVRAFFLFQGCYHAICYLLSAICYQIAPAKNGGEKW